MLDLFYHHREQFNELLAGSVDQEDFEGLKEMGHGGAGSADILAAEK